MIKRLREILFGKKPEPPKQVLLAYQIVFNYGDEKPFDRHFYSDWLEDRKDVDIFVKHVNGKISELAQGAIKHLYLSESSPTASSHRVLTRRNVELGIILRVEEKWGYPDD